MSYRLTSYVAFTALLFGGAVMTAPVEAQTFEPPAAKEGFSYPDVYCTNRGTRVELDALACLRVGGKTFVARCSMAQNNPMWRKVEDGCPAKLEAALDAAAAAATASASQTTAQ